MTNSKKPIIGFDLDGTLLDTVNVHMEVYKEVFEKNRLPYKSNAEIRKVMSYARDNLIRKLFPKITDRRFKQIEEDCDKILEKYSHHAKAFPGVPNALAKLKKHFRLAIISNSTHIDILILLNGAKLDPRIFDVIAGDTDVRKPKPAANEINRVERMIGGKVKYMVGDSPVDIRAGRSAGVKTIGVLTGMGSLESLWKENPTFVVKSVAELPSVLCNE